MKDRRSSRSNAPQFGLLAWLESTRIALPLKGVECHFDVTGTIANVEVDQIFHQDAPQPVDCTYVFPLPAGAAVHRCELHVNGRVIRAKVESEEMAKEIYDRQRAAGRRAALVQTERENLFTLSLGNLQPGDLVVVRFAWFQVLERLGDELRLRVPTCPGVRYIPGTPLVRANSGHGSSRDTDRVPDGSRISPPRIDSLHRDCAYFAIRGAIAGCDAEEVSSPSHSIFVRKGDGRAAVELAQSDAIPDRDFVLAWREPKSGQLGSRGWRFDAGPDAYGFIQLRAPQEADLGSRDPGDFYFLVDRSGSMAGKKWAGTCEALKSFVRLLGQDDRVWITLFESQYRDFDEVPVPAPQVLADAGFLCIERLSPGGGTELLPAAERVLGAIAAHSSGRRVTIVLITDGQVGDEEAILRRFGAVPEVTVHTFGIDTAVNDAFLKALSARHHGHCWLATPDDDIVGIISGLARELRPPVLTNVAVELPWIATRTQLPDVHAGGVITLAVRGVGCPDRCVISAVRADGTPSRIEVDLQLGNEAIKFLWARDRIASLIETDRETAVAIAKGYNIICKGTAFVEPHPSGSR